MSSLRKLFFGVDNRGTLSILASSAGSRQQLQRLAPQKGQQTLRRLCCLRKNRKPRSFSFIVAFLTAALSELPRDEDAGDKEIAAEGRLADERKSGAACGETSAIYSASGTGGGR